MAAPKAVTATAIASYGVLSAIVSRLSLKILDADTAAIHSSIVCLSSLVNSRQQLTPLPPPNRPPIESPTDEQR